ncbi:hypothetical protein Gorai_023716, partial [Gossypium raimondii]|nr:hypothetical protein [Gossypium raimondii]
MSNTWATYWIQLYIDGAVKLDLEEAVAGGVLKNHHGQWILGFNRRLGWCFVFNAELWGILHGLIILQNKKWDKVSIRTGSMEVIQSIKETEENMEVDRIAKLAFDQNEGLQLFAKNPPNTSSLMSFFI